MNNEKQEAWLITGSTGFVGQHLCEKLVNLYPNFSFFALARDKTRFERKNISGICVEGDLDNISWVETLPDNLSGVVHVAGLIHSFNPKDFYTVNVEGSKNLMMALIEKYQKNSSALKIILISSLAANGPIDANGPVGNYGQSKLEGENMIKSLLPSHWTLSIIRPPIVIGPKDLALFDLYSLVKSNFAMRVGKKGNERKYHFICVFDLIDYIITVMNSNWNGTTYAYYPCEVTFGQITQKMGDKIGKKNLFHFYIPEFLIKMLSKIGHIPVFPKSLRRVTPDKVKEILATGWISPDAPALNFHYKYDLDQTLEITVKDYQLYEQTIGKKDHEKHECCAHN